MWLKLVSGCPLSFERDVLKSASVSSVTIKSLHPAGDRKHFVSLDDDHAVRIQNYSDMDTVRVLKIGKGEVHGTAVVHHKNAKSSLLIFSEGADDLIRCSEVTLDKAAVSPAAAGALFELDRGVLGVRGFLMTCLSVSKDGKFVAVGCDDGIVGVWELDGSRSGCYVLSFSFSCSEDGAKEDSVKSAVVSSSGQFVAAWSSGGDLFFWRKEIGNTKEVTRVARPAFDDDEKQLGSLLLSNDGTVLVVVYFSTAAYEVWDVETGERRFSMETQPNTFDFTAAFLAGSSGGGEGGLSLLVGEMSVKGYHLVEYSIGKELEEVQRWRLPEPIFSVCSAVFIDETELSAEIHGIGDETELSGSIVGSAGGTVCLLGARVSDARERLKKRESDIRGKQALRHASLSELADVWTVAVMPDAGRVVAGHQDGSLSFWSAEDGGFVSAVGSTKEVGGVTCIDISADGSVAATGHTKSTALVWDVPAWTVRCVLEGNNSICGVATLTNTNRAFAFDFEGEWCLWDAGSGGAARRGAARDQDGTAI